MCYYSTSNLTYRLYWKRHPCISFNKCFLATNYFVLNLFLPYIIFWSHPKNLSKSLAFWCFQGESLKETFDRKQSINPGKVSWTCRFSFFSSSTILNWTRGPLFLWIPIFGTLIYFMSLPSSITLENIRKHLIFWCFRGL